MNSQIFNQGYLEIIMGPMFAGKSSELIRLSKRYEVLGKNIISINHKSDKRYGNTDITTHNRTSLQTKFSIEKLEEIDEFIIKHTNDVLLIDEIQFFPDAFHYVKKWVDIYSFPCQLNAVLLKTTMQLRVLLLSSCQCN